ncbi:MAG: hypothetical protein P0Y53_25035 [Candidatus Pseudobacter hemicellulosilyticus]|uniref:Uncharacterized protein n=1 Tax=Candidatus Pseudobacter hemicellulosilyticus TaxID=3121375 RepID=A0AAJ6BHC9_9BACT|nr:MAG: hypothetical protein P0Y53_25035 [Pseudobacter sp.]
MSANKMYSIPDRFRRIENLHIFFWLLKDICWCMTWRTLGIIMLIPTLTVAILITWQTRKLKAELFHNLAVAFWICANGYWMIIEFFGYDEQLRIFTVIPFSIGLFFIVIYYVYVRPREMRKEKLVTISVEVPETTLQVAQSA